MLDKRGREVAQCDACWGQMWVYSVVDITDSVCILVGIIIIAQSLLCRCIFGVIHHIGGQELGMFSA